jgi:Fur family peroxide stress response transcriptional regulator
MTPRPPPRRWSPRFGARTGFRLPTTPDRDRFANEKDSYLNPPGDDPDIDTQLERFADACRERGTPVTHQRLAIFRALLESASHPDAEALHKGLRRSYPTLALGTVYKTLDMLQSMGLANAVSSPGPTRRFDGNRHPHHHLWCTRCRRLTDVELDALADLPLPAGIDFQVTDVTIQFNGLCADCSTPDPMKGAPR